MTKQVPLLVDLRLVWELRYSYFLVYWGSAEGVKCFCTDQKSVRDPDDGFGSNCRICFWT